MGWSNGFFNGGRRLYPGATVNPNVFLSTPLSYGLDHDGKGNGSVWVGPYILFQGTKMKPGPVSVGSRLGQTTVVGYNVELTGKNVNNPGHAQIGWIFNDTWINYNVLVKRFL